VIGDPWSLTTNTTSSACAEMQQGVRVIRRVSLPDSSVSWAEPGRGTAGDDLTNLKNPAGNRPRATYRSPAADRYASLCTKLVRLHAHTR
jgi:hypothetical protein